MLLRSFVVLAGVVACEYLKVVSLAHVSESIQLVTVLILVTLKAHAISL
jgi:hypothetical protein